MNRHSFADENTQIIWYSLFFCNWRVWLLIRCYTCLSHLALSTTYICTSCSWSYRTQSKRTCQASHPSVHPQSTFLHVVCEALADIVYWYNNKATDLQQHVKYQYVNYEKRVNCTPTALTFLSLVICCTPKQLNVKNHVKQTHRSRRRLEPGHIKID